MHSAVSCTVGIFTFYRFTVFGHYVLATPIQLVSVLFIAALYTGPRIPNFFLYLYKC